MSRRCSHCSSNGHNSRTCPARGVKLFGVRLDNSSIRKSASMGNLMHHSGGGGGSSPDGVDGGGPAEKEEGGYASEGFVKGSGSGRERKKGVAWTEEEHKKFLLGLRKLGKGDWRGISRDYVVSRSPTQVASHAQKYFIRQSNVNRRKKRSSLFDIVPDESGDSQAFTIGSEEPEAEGSIPLPARPSLDAELEAVGSISHERVGSPLPKPETVQYSYPVMYPAFYPAYYPIPLPFYPGYMPGYRVETMENKETTENKAHGVFKPTALHSRIPISADQLVDMTTLSLRDSVGQGSPSPAAPSLLGCSERHSAFHAITQPAAGSSMNSGSSPIHAI
ncbi:uncharacterized protein M6B38_316395 [Iris pallida]|uniref:Uncharacterized protein n=1 Tax=Iris pallida TaxID=29817 RepID=A0AAX6HEH4_IRIPA|nr:uncharacterized protein M6B38_316395 [Iris pallida]